MNFCGKKCKHNAGITTVLTQYTMYLLANMYRRKMLNKSHNGQQNK